MKSVNNENIDQFNNLLKTMDLNKSSEFNNKAESVTSDDTIFSEDYFLPVENESDELLVPRPADIENALTNLLTTDSTSNGTLENEGEPWNIDMMASCNDKNLSLSYQSDSFFPENPLEFHSALASGENEFDFVKQPIRRSTSLKLNKTPPDTPRHKKAVRFADALGLDLESVRHILDIDNPPVIPQSAMKYLRTTILPFDSDQFMVGNRYLSACFPQPSSLLDYMSRVHDNKVLLEHCSVDDREMTVAGTIRVVNLAFHKKVAVRYTFNAWLTHDEIAANYMYNSSDGPTDKFSFVIHIPSWFDVGNKMQFAIMYAVNGQTFWDNNYGCNYIVECFAKSLPSNDGDRLWMY